METGWRPPCAQPWPDCPLKARPPAAGRPDDRHDSADDDDFADERAFGRRDGDRRTIALPELRKHGYDTLLISGVNQAGSGLGILIPPPFVLVMALVLVMIFPSTALWPPHVVGG